MLDWTESGRSRYPFTLNAAWVFFRRKKTVFSTKHQFLFFQTYQNNIKLKRRTTACATLLLFYHLQSNFASKKQPAIIEEEEVHIVQSSSSFNT